LVKGGVVQGRFRDKFGSRKFLGSKFLPLNETVLWCINQMHEIIFCDGILILIHGDFEKMKNWL